MIENGENAMTSASGINSATSEPGLLTSET
jgi:hypothetical protein